MTLAEKLDRVRNGQDTEGRLELYNWVLTTVTDLARKPEQPLSDEDCRILLAGEYTDSDGNITTFGLPEDLA